MLRVPTLSDVSSLLVLAPCGVQLHVYQWFDVRPGPHTSLGPHSISRRGADTRHRDRNESRDQAEPSVPGPWPSGWDRADTRLAGDSDIVSQTSPSKVADDSVICSPATPDP